jgi:hypothetical protein
LCSGMMVCAQWMIGDMGSERWYCAQGIGDRGSE